MENEWERNCKIIVHHFKMYLWNWTKGKIKAFCKPKKSNGKNQIVSIFSHMSNSETTWTYWITNNLITETKNGFENSTQACILDIRENINELRHSAFIANKNNHMHKIITSKIKNNEIIKYYS